MKKNYYRFIALIMCAVMLIFSGNITVFAAEAAKPAAFSVKNTVGGIKVKWKKVKGANGYRLYKKVGSKGKWKKLRDVKSCYYTDKKVKNAKYYTYKVKAYSGSKKWFSHASKSKTIVCTSRTSKVKATERYDQIVVTFKKVKKADKYYIYRKCGKKGKYKYIGYSDKNFYFDNKTKMGKTYYYKVRTLINGKKKVFKSALSKQSNAVKCYQYSGECARSGHTLKGKSRVIKPTAVLKGYTETVCKCGLKTVITKVKKPLGYTKPNPDAYAYPEAVKRNNASDEFLNSLIEKNRNNLIQVRFGTENEIRYLKAQTDEIVKYCETDYQKAREIYKWIVDNVDYEYYHSPYSAEVYRTKKAVCLGFANLMVDMLRLENIPAAVLTGFRGNMKNYYTERKLEADRYNEGHAWVKLYADGRWVFADPTFGIYDPSAKELDIPEYYYTVSTDFVCPYYKNMNMLLTKYSVYIDGRYYAFDDGKQVDFTSGSFSYLSSGYDVDFICVNYTLEKVNNKIVIESPMNSSYRYRLGELYKGLVINNNYGFIGCFAYNGLRLNQTDYTRGDKNYLMNKSGHSVFRYSDYSGILESYYGLPSIKKGERIKLVPAESKKGYYYHDKDYLKIRSHKWESSNTSVATVDKNGVVKAVGKGEVTIRYTYVCEPASQSYASESIDLYITDKGSVITKNALAPRDSIAANRSELYDILPY